MLNLKCNKIMLQSHLQKLSGQVVTGRDISNIRVKKSKSDEDKNDIEKIAANSQGWGWKAGENAPQ